MMTFIGWEAEAVLDVSRQERKYVLSPLEVPALIKRVSAFARADIHNGEEGYGVWSVYFDTVGSRDLWDKVNGEFRRQKLRLRTYSQGDTIKLELKEKLGEYQRKRSLELSHGEAEAALRGDFSFLPSRQEAFAWGLYCFAAANAYRPRLTVFYRRRAYYLEENDTRITFDSQIAWSRGGLTLFPKPLITPIGGNQTVLEVKYRGYLQSNLKLALGDRIQESVGKYSLCAQGGTP